jgi:hypothetical protein
MRSMENKENILQELRQLSEAVADLSKGNTYSVPAGFFDEFATLVLARIEAENAAFGDKTTAFSVPAGYFDSLAGNILNKIKQQELSVEEELNELAPLLNTISKKPVFTVPEGYFESLEIAIPLKVATPAAKVFSMAKPRRILQYAVAACTAGVLMVGAYMYTHKASVPDSGTASAVIPYDSAVKMNVSEELASVNEQEIDQYLKQSPTIASNAATTSPTDDVDLELFINSTSDDEIKEYLEQNAEPSKTNSGT